MIVTVRLFGHFSPVVWGVFTQIRSHCPLLDLSLTVPDAVLDLLCTGVLVILNSSNKCRIGGERGGGALINFFVPNVRLFEGGA